MFGSDSLLAFTHGWNVLAPSKPVNFVEGLTYKKLVSRCSKMYIILHPHAVKDTVHFTSDTSSPPPQWSASRKLKSAQAVSANGMKVNPEIARLH